MKRLGLFLASVLTLAPLAAQASPWYLGAAAGSSNAPSQFVTADARIFPEIQVPGFDGTQQGLFLDTSSNAPSSNKTSAAGYDVFVGYHWNSNWAWEAHYFDMGSATSDHTLQGVGTCNVPNCLPALITATEHVSAKTDGFSFNAVGTAPLNGSWSGFATFGAAHVSTNVTTSVVTASISDDATKWAATYGIGVQLNAGTHWSFRFGWQQFHDVGDSSYAGTGSVNYVFLSALCSL